MMRGKPLKRRYMEFGLVLGTILLAAGLLPLLKHAGPRWWLVGPAAAVYAAAAFAPSALRLPHDVMVKLGHVLGKVNAYVFLGLCYYLVITPLAALMRLTGSTPVKDGFGKGEGSLWQRREPSDPKSFGRMF